jgi:spermidine synthase
LRPEEKYHHIMPVYPVLVLCFFLSGATALIYEVVWVRLLTLSFGNTVYAVGVVLIAFMSGLSLGSYILGRWADRDVNLLRLYGILEFGIAVSTLLSVSVLEWLASAYLSLSPSSMHVWKASGLRYVLSAAVLIVPATLMGGTLPVLVRFAVRSRDELGERLGMLYSMNTVGGVLGTFLAGFLMIRFAGLRLTLVSAAGLNLCIGALSCYLGAVAGARGAPKVGRGEVGQQKGPVYVYAIFAFFLSGSAAMIYEVAWTRLLVGVIGSTTFAFSIVLIGFLSGIGLGSLAVSRLSRVRRLGLVHFSLMEIAIGVIGVFTIVLYRAMPSMMLYGLRGSDGQYFGVLVYQFLLVLIFLLVPTIVMGATFPVIANVYCGESERRGRRIGELYAANTAGAILGSALAAFYLLPGFGSTICIKTAALLNLAVGATGLLALGKKRAFAVSLSLLAVPFIPAGISSGMLDSGVAIYGREEGYSLSGNDGYYLYQKEGLNSTVSVTASDSGNISLRINGKADASISSDMSTQLAVGYFPALLHPRPRDALVVGLGSGVTTRALADFPGMKTVETVEIEPAVLEAAQFFDRVNRGVHRDPGVTIILDDARSYLMSADRQYDIIVSEPSNPWISGIGSLFTREFYETSRSRLRKGGVFCQWVHIYGLRTDDLRMILATFVKVFPDSSAWQSGKGDIMLIGPKGPHPALDYDAVKGMMSGRVAGDLMAYLNISDPMDFFSYFITGAGGIKAFSDGAPVNTDDRPLLEFSAPMAMYLTDRTVMENNSRLSDHLEVPAIAGHEGEGDVTAEFLYRKSRNYRRLNIPAPLSWIREAISRDAGNADYLVHLARVMAVEGRFSLAGSLLGEALAKEPENAGAHYMRAMLLKDRDAGQALGHMDRALRSAPEDFDILVEAAEFSFDEGMFEGANGLFLRAYDQPHQAIADGYLLYSIGLTFAKLKKYGQAVDYLERSVGLNAYDFESVLALADTYLFVGRPGDACARYADALRLSGGEDRGLVEERIDSYCGDVI